MSRLKKTAIILGALLVGYALFGFLIAPPLVRHFGERYLQKNFGAESAIERVRIDPFRASIKVEGLFLTDPAGAWSVAWQEAELNASAASWVKFYPVVDVVRLDGADIRYERQPGEAGPANSPDSAAQGTWREQVEQLNLAEIPKIRVDLLEVTGGRFEFVDPTAAEGFTETVDPINFTLRDLTTVVDREGDAAMRFLAVTEAGGRLLWEGNFQSQPIRSAGSFSLSGLAVHDLSPYFAELIRFDLERAVYALSFDYTLDLSQLDNLLHVRAGQMALTEVLCRPVDAADRLIAVESVGLDGIDFRFPAMALEIAEIAVKNGETRIARDAEGQINLLDLIAMPKKAEVADDGQVDLEDAAAETGEPLPELSYQVATITFSDYRILWEDALSAGRANLAVDIPQMQLTGISSDLESPCEIEAEYILGETGTANLAGSIVPAGPDLDLALQVKSLPLEILSAYAEEFGNASIRSGIFNFEGEIQYAKGGTQAMTGSASIQDAALAYAGQLDADWALLDLAEMRVEFAPFSLALDALALEEPVLVFRQTAGADTETAAAADAAPAQSTGGDVAVPVRIESLRVSNGRFTLNDARMDPAAEIVVDALALDVSGLDLAGGQAAGIGLSAQVNGSRLAINGSADPSRLKAATNLKISLEGLALPAFSPYSGQAIGRRIASGQFNLESDWQIQANQLKAANKMRIESFKLGDRVESGGATSLPLDLAITLLKGPNGIMDLSLPLSGDLSDPKVGLGQIIRTAFVGLVTNVASAPFKMLAGLVGGEAELSFVRFEAGSSELGSEMTTRLNKLAEALKERPGIQLSMTPEISEADLVRLTEEKLRLELMSGAEAGDERIYRRRLTQRYREQMQAAGTPDRETSAENAAGLDKMVAALLPGVVLTDSDRSALAGARAAAIREHLVVAQGIAAERVVAGEPEVGTAAARVVFELR